MIKKAKAIELTQRSKNFPLKTAVIFKDEKIICLNQQFMNDEIKSITLNLDESHKLKDFLSEVVK